jgi:hypothetical protein
MRDRWFLAIPALMVVFVLAFLYAAHRHRQRCIDAGGTWQRVNCRQVEVSDEMITTDGSGNMSTIYLGHHIVTQCDDFCVVGR